MAIKFYYPKNGISVDVRMRVERLFEKNKGEVTNVVLNGTNVLIVLNEGDISGKKGREFLERMIDIVNPCCWSTCCGDSLYGVALAKRYIQLYGIDNMGVRCEYKSYLK